MALSENLEKQTSPSKGLPDLVYLTADVGSVFESQVVSLLKYYLQKNWFRSIHLVCGISSEQEKARVCKALDGNGIEVLFFENRPNYFFFNAAQQKHVFTALQCLPNDLKEPIVHIRGELLALHASKPILKKWGSLKRVLVDIRGAGWEEVLEFQRMSFLLKILKKPNYTKAFKRLAKFGSVSAVSEELKLYVGKSMGNSKHPIHVVPCLVSDNFERSKQSRNRIRTELGIQEQQKLIVFSSGGNAGWQQNEVLEKMVSERWQILNLSACSIEAEGVINRFVSYSEVPDYLAAADAAIIFRSHSVVNKVACPVKFCEYLCAGLPVIANNSVDLIKSTLEQHAFGCLISNAESIHALTDEALFEFNDQSIANYGKTVFGIEAVAATYQSIYSSLV
jgi:glycosyltransferase involved in cell wall biosynthesis